MSPKNLFALRCLIFLAAGSTQLVQLITRAVLPGPMPPLFVADVIAGTTLAGVIVYLWVCDFGSVYLAIQHVMSEVEETKSHGGPGRKRRMLTVLGLMHQVQLIKWMGLLVGAALGIAVGSRVESFVLAAVAMLIPLGVAMLLEKMKKDQIDRIHL